MRRASLLCLIAVAACAQPSAIPEPLSDPQRFAIEKIRQRGLQYVRELPNFVCTQVTVRNVGSSGATQKWKPLDTIEEDLNYFDHRETYKVLSINGRPAPKAAHTSLGNLGSTGEFGSLLRRIFEPESRAELKWVGLDTLKDRPVQVLSYRVPRESSMWTLARDRHRTVVGYHGMIFADAATDAALRVTVINDIPADFPIDDARMEIDYDFISISGKKYLLPVQSVNQVRLGRSLFQNTIRFSKYRKFTADTEITFDFPPEGPPPAPPKKN